MRAGPFRALCALAGDRSRGARMSGTSLLQVEGLRKWFPVRPSAFARGPKQLRAVDGISFTIDRGEVLGLVGESGSGKTTVGRTILRVFEPTEGRIVLDGTDIAHLSPAALRPFRRRMQLVFQ